MLRKITATLPPSASPNTADPAWTFGSPASCCAPAALAGTAAQAERGSRRRRLWELSRHAHCPVIGVCLPIAALRRLMNKVPGAAEASDDFELHGLAVTECQRRGVVAEAVQADLDRRYRPALRSTAALKTTEALQAWWDAQGHTHDLPGALWALLSHPRCDDTLEDRVLGQVHMLQHQVGMATRVELARFEALIDENAVLARSLAAAQQRNQQQTAEHARQTLALQAELVQVRGQRLAADSERQALAEDLAALQARVPDLASRQALQERCAWQAERINDLQRALVQAQQALANSKAQVPTPGTATPAETAQPAQAESPAAAAGPRMPTLTDQAVLCVGGRTASVPIYRRLVEACGGRFLHHDGGEEDAVRRLDATLAAADLVICQTGCLSHEAYWRVKDHCKRTGKRCVFVDTPSAAHLQRALGGIELSDR